VELVGGNSDFRTKAEFPTVGEARGHVVKDTGGIHPAEETLGSGSVAGDNGVRVVGTMGVDVRDRLLE